VGTETPKASEDEEVKESYDQDEVAQIMADVKDQHSRKSYSAAAQKDKSKKEKEFSPFFLSIHRGDSERASMKGDVFQIFYEKLQDMTADLVFAGKEAPDVEWSGFAKGVGLICLADAASMNLTKELVKKITVENESFRAWEAAEKDDYIPITIKIPSTLRGDKFTAGKLAALMAAQNKLPMEAGDCKVKGAETLSGHTRVLRLAVSEKLMSAIQEKGGMIRIAMSKLEVFHKGKPLCGDGH